MAALSTHKEMVHIEGLTDLQRTLTKTMPREARNILRRTVVSIAKGVRDDMRETVRQNSEDDGTLRRAIRHKRQKGAFEHEEAAVFITHGKGAKYDAFYYHFVEFGTVKSPERPYIRPTVKSWEGNKLNTTFRREFGVQFEREMAKRAKK